MVGSRGRPAVLDDYTSADVVARSQASVLFRVARLRDGDVALKVFQLGGKPEEQAFARTWMLADWRIWSELAHPHVLSVSDFGERNDSLYVATPWIDGPSLRSVLDQRRTLDAGHVRQLATQLAGALDAGAAVHLVHLDVKPENVLFSSADRSVHAYVTDFGAGSLAARKVGADRSRSYRGTSEYAAPEQLQEGSIDRRAMVYSLGCLLYETLTGTTPYASRSRDAAPPPVADAPAEVGRVFAKALAYRRADRYTTCTDFAEALCEALAFARAPAPDPPPVIRRRRSYGLRHVTAVAAVALVACGAATAASWLMRGAAPGGSHPAPGTPAASRDFVAALRDGRPTVKSARKSLRTAPSATRGDGPASLASGSGTTKPERHPVSGTSRPPATSKNAHNATSTPAGGRSATGARQAASVAAPHPSGSSLPATTTSAAASTLSPPPPPPASSDPSPPLPPPPP